MALRFARYEGIAGLALTACITLSAGAQEPAVASTVACVHSACALVVDWGTGKTAGTYGADRRYGSGDDFESGIRRALTAHGVSVQPVGGAAFTITIRPRVDSRAMCDRMAGTGTSYACAVVSDAAVAFATTDPAFKAPGGLRLSNRCGGEQAYLTMSQFGQYVGEMLWWTMVPAAAREKKPSLRC